MYFCCACFGIVKFLLKGIWGELGGLCAGCAGGFVCASSGDETGFISFVGEVLG